MDSLGLYTTDRWGEDDASGDCKESFENGAEGDTLGARGGGCDCSCACIASGNDVEGDRVPWLAGVAMDVP